MPTQKRRVEVQRTREEEEQLKMQVLHASTVIADDAAKKLQKFWDTITQLQDKKGEDKK